MDDLAREQSASRILWHEVAGVLLRRRKLILGVFISGAVTSLILSFLQGPMYRASSKLMVTSKRARMTVSPDPREGATVDRVTDQDLNSEVALLQSPSLLHEVLEPYAHEIALRQAQSEDHSFVHRLATLARYPIFVPGKVYRRIHGVPPMDPLDEWVLATQAKLMVNAVKLSNLIQVSYDSADPKWAADFLNSLISHHVEWHVRINQQAEAVGFFESQRELLQEQLRNASDALAAFYQREGIDSSAEQRDALRTRVNQLVASLANAETELSETAARADFLGRELQRQPKNVAAGSKMTTTDPFQLMKSKILDLELQRSQLLSKFAPGSLKVQEMDRQIADARRLLAEREKAGGAEAAASNPVYQKLGLDLAQAQAQVAAVKARRESLGAQLAGDQAKLEHLDAIASEQERLEQEVKNAKEVLLTYSKKQEEARFSEALDRSGIINVTIVEPAAVPTAPQPSKRQMILLLGTAMSLFAGLGVAFIRDRIDPSVKSAAEAANLSGLTILADIPS